MAAAKGLPNRFITSIAMDPANPRTVYVTLAGYERRWAPPGAVEEQVRNVGVGHVYRSTDAGEHFANVSGNLPDDPANWVTIDKGHLLVGNDLGVLISSDLIGSHWDVLGTNLPAVPVHSIQVTPRNPDEILIATFGRGLYTYRFPPSPPHP
jgi:hypothetical protein